MMRQNCGRFTNFAEVGSAAHQLNKFPGDGEAEADAVLLCRFADLHEGFENMRLLLLEGDAYPRVLRAELSGSCPALSAGPASNRWTDR